MSISISMKFLFIFHFYMFKWPYNNPKHAWFILCVFCADENIPTHSRHVYLSTSVLNKGFYKHAGRRGEGDSSLKSKSNFQHDTPAYRFTGLE